MREIEDGKTERKMKWTSVREESQYIYRMVRLKEGGAWSSGYGTHVPKAVGSNPSSAHWMDILHINLL